MVWCAWYDIDSFNEGDCYSFLRLVCNIMCICPVLEVLQKSQRILSLISKRTWGYLHFCILSFSQLLGFSFFPFVAGPRCLGRFFFKVVKGPNLGREPARFIRNTCALCSWNSFMKKITSLSAAHKGLSQFIFLHGNLNWGKVGAYNQTSG